MKFNLISFYILFFFIIACDLVAQSDKVIQLSGLVVTETKDEPSPLPFAEIRTKNTNRGVYASESGFFSIAVQLGDTLVFRYIGYKDAFYAVPNSLQEEHYTIFQILSKDEILLPETVVYPWPKKEHFKQEFLAMDVSNPLREIAEQNLAQKNIKRLMDLTPSDGQSNASYYLSTQAKKAYYNGQFQPMNILSPTAWIEFFKAWKRGDFKVKKSKYE